MVSNWIQPWVSVSVPRSSSGVNIMVRSPSRTGYPPRSSGVALPGGGELMGGEKSPAPFDPILREGDLPEVNDAVNALFRAAAERGIHTGRVVGHGAMEDPQDI
ncbi:MAG: hypothetical protein OXE49_07820, partial [Gemmatimonadetes bacterium]|nr:hypothetical protein [Gemmatimonadota bacterium]